MVVIAGVWVITIIQNVKLYKAFLAKYPQEAERAIPFAFSNTSHPEKLLFFFRKTSFPMLKADLDLWRQRQWLKLFLIISFLLPLVCFGFLALVALTESRP